MESFPWKVFRREANREAERSGKHGLPTRPERCYGPRVRACPQCGVECETDHRFCPACGFPIGALRTAAGDPLIGRTLGGAYVILEHVGSGGMGRVYRAEQASLGKTLAVKVIHPHLISDESATARFYTEARASSRLNHPNSVSVLDFGRTDDGLLYLVMEFLRGKDLAHILWENGPMAAPRAANILKQVLTSLAEAHDLGIIHRDIKPENILIEPMRTGGDFCKVVDFGLAKVRADVAPSITTPGIVCGTPDYMAPEQGRGDALDARTDLYACGVVLFQMLTNRVPFEADSPTQVVLMHMSDPIPDPRSVVATIPEPIARVVFKAMAKEARDRHQSAVEFASALDDAVKEIETGLQSRRSDPKAVTLALQTCPSCGAMMQIGVKFCSECGSRVTATIAPNADTTGSLRPRVSEKPPGAITQPEARALSLVGRDREIAVLESARTRAANGRMVSIRIQGDEGAGKSRLLHELMDRSRHRGDAIVAVEPDVTWAGVAYAPVADCVRQCLEIAPADDALAWLTQAETRDKSIDVSVVSGFEELFTPNGPQQLDGRARRAAVVRALGFALKRATARTSGGVALVAVEKLHRMDSASRAAWAALASGKLDAPVLLVGTHTPRVDPGWSHSDAVVLGPLPRALVPVALAPVLGAAAADAIAALDAAIPTQDVSPLYLDQLARWISEGGGQSPARLVDLISARFERLPPRSRHVVQTLALLGEASEEILAKIIGEEFDAGTLFALKAGGWTRATVTAEREAFRIDHPLVREVAEASIPAAARREMLTRCRAALSGAALPLEVRAMLGATDDNSFEALILYDRMGDLALARGDDLGAAMALRRGLERARREMARGEIDDPERAIAIFARKLGEALLRSGEPAEAEGVLREGLEVVPRTNVEWARLEGTLARALQGRGKSADAVRAADEALRCARRLNARSVAAELSVTRADLEIALGNDTEAVACLRGADELVREAMRSPSAGSHSTPPADDVLLRLRIDILLRLSRALRAVGEESAANDPLTEARNLADKHGLRAERVRCDAESAERAEQMGERHTAVSAWRLAATAARSIGDISAADTYDGRASRLASGAVAGANARR